jgi:hypothetical protein
LLKKIIAKDGNPSLELDGKALLSKYQPLKDIHRLIPEAAEGKSFILFSNIAGMLKPQLKQAGINEDTIYTFEPVAMQDLGYQGDEPGSMSEWIELQLMKRHMIEIIALPSMAKVWPGEFRIFQERIRQSIVAATENIKVSSYFSKVWFINYCRNLVIDSYLIPQELKDAEVPVVVCAAGPSLGDHLEELKAHQDEIFIISVLSAYNTLAQAGVRPDTVLLNDAGVGNILHGADLQQDIPVLAHIYSSSAFLSGIQNPVIFYNTEQEISSPLFQLDQPSVSIDAGSIARHISSGPLVFCGLDLCYPAGRNDHSSDNAFHKRAFLKQNRFSTSDSTDTAFLGRPGLERSDKGWTQGHFQIIRRIIESRFTGQYYLPGGVEFNGLSSLSSINNLSGLSKCLKSAIINELKSQRMPESFKNSGIAEYFLVREPNRVFVRETLQQDTPDKLVRYYRKKMNKLWIRE